MIRKILLLSLSITSYSLFAQNDCSDGRYKEPLFPEVLITSGIPFGQAPTTYDTIAIPGTDSINTFPLFMDVYQPLLDTVTPKRPVIVFAFGGAFVYGARVSPDIVKLCTMYAQMGYVAVSIDYRLSDELLTAPNPYNATKAVLKGVHDMKAAVRFLRKSVAELDNIFRIDHKQIYVGGVSAGAFCAIHAAYLDKEEELPEILKPTAKRYGGIEGQSGNPGYSSKVAGVINLCGAVGDTTWIEPGNVPIVSMHGTADATVPYDHDTITILGINYPVHGSASIHRHIGNMNNVYPDQAIPHAFYTWYGADHVPFLTDSAYFDTTFRFTRDFMFERVCSGLGSSITENQRNNTYSHLYPNPAADKIKIVALSANYTVNVVDATGKVMDSLRSKGLEQTLDISAYPSGLYLIRVNGENFQQTHRLIKQ